MKKQAIMMKVINVFLLGVFLTAISIAQQTDITGPAGSGKFGTEAIALPNGNIVVTDPDFDLPGPITDVGAVYLYNGSTGALISTLTGSQMDDRVGNNGITVLTNGNYVISSTFWANGTEAAAGAATWGDATTGVSGVISSANSLVGSTANDLVGLNGITILPNGNYVVRSQNWNNNTIDQAGAVTWGNGTTGIFGVITSTNSVTGSITNDNLGEKEITVLTNGNFVISCPFCTGGVALHAGAVRWVDGATGGNGFITPANSIFGSNTNDNVGGGEVKALSNGNYVFSSPNWDNAGVTDVGAVTWGNGSMRTSATVSSTNSIVGSTANDFVGNDGLIALTNGNYVVVSTNWDGAAVDVGAVTFGDGTAGTAGTISSSNSLVGSTAFDLIGNFGVTALTNGNYVVNSFNWDGAAANVGAVTWGDGTSGVSGAISSANSLVGSTANDVVGSQGVTALTNGNYVVASANWDGIAVNTGAATWGNGSTGVSGAVSVSNSLVGSTADDFVSLSGVTALTNGNYVVASASWDGVATNTGAATWGNGSTGVSGAVASSNSLVGSTSGDLIGNSGVTALTNGNYVVRSPDWDGVVTNAGAATWGNGTTGITGTVSSANSLVGSTMDDDVSKTSVTALPNGNYVVVSKDWDGTATDVGAVTFGSGTTGISGAVSTTNSLVGSTVNDQVGSSGVTPLQNGNYVVKSEDWDNGAIVGGGAVSYLSGLTGNFAPIASTKKDKKEKSESFGAITMMDSVLGTSLNNGVSMNFSFDGANNQLVVGRPNDNKVTLFNRMFATSSTASVSGKVQRSSGIGIPNAIVSITDSLGQIRSVRVNQFGYFGFNEIEVGETYVFNVSAKGYLFTSQVINIDEDLTDLSFIPQ